MIPIADESPKGYIPFVNYVLIALNIAVFFFLQQDTEVFYQSFGLTPKKIVQTPSNVFGYFTIFTSMFMHGGLMHLLGNMLYLWIFGDNIEYTIGHKRYIFFYFTVGLGAAVLQIIVFPDSAVPMIGASGAVSGVLGAYLLKYPKNKVSILFFFFIFIRVVKIPALMVLGLWFVFQIWSGYAAMESGAGEGGVAWFAHIGGFVAGLLLINIFEKFPKR